MTTRTAAQYMAKLNATLIVAWDASTQFATVYKVAGRVEANRYYDQTGHEEIPVATLRRRRVIGEASQPAWTCVTTKGHEVTYDSALGVTPRGLLLRLAVHLIDQHETVTAAHSTSQPQGQPLTLDMVEDHKPIKPLRYTIQVRLDAGHDMTAASFTFVATSKSDAKQQAAHAMRQLGFKPSDYQAW